MTDWGNLLLSCSYCNSRKSEKVKKGESNKWLWPDQDNTFLAFTYKNGIPALNEHYLNSLGTDTFEKAKAIFEGLALDYCPGGDEPQPQNHKKKYVDKRWMTRFETLTIAENAKELWDKCQDDESRTTQLKNITALAGGYGFFSIWMMVFEDVDIVKNALIHTFPGTSMECFDQNGNPVRRENGVI